MSKISCSENYHWDWKVTVCFYSALHLMNAHIVKKTQKNYLTHNQVNKLINPYEVMSPAKLDENTFLAYNKLLSLSRRSRYLLKENHDANVDIQDASLTYDKHFRKSVIHLETIMNYIVNNYNVSFKKRNLKCVELETINLNFFKII
ncbi:hypothetical protein [Flavobacteriaceae bacterium 14752]|uniref:hypothetical protein n=1 Tax=Mesohalobacter salilacus TaxID=2491711 RepID=UPI000F62D80E|nr:hypothetical protein EIG84_05755 [Flavobacteriaceae bacterium 14752]